MCIKSEKNKSVIKKNRGRKAKEARKKANEAINEIHVGSTAQRLCVD